MDDKQHNTFARVGTSFGAGNAANPIMRPTSKTGRIASGFVRPGTSKGQSRGGAAANEPNKLKTRAGVPTTSSGRALRLSTASLAQVGDKFFESERENMKQLAKKKSKSRLIFKYLFYVEHNLKKALELAAEATVVNDMKDPWWKLALGKCYYHMGMIKDAEKQLQSSVKHNNNVESYMYLSRIYQKEDQVPKAISIL
jgi:tetratricopeptide repeat protein 8